VRFSWVGVGCCSGAGTPAPGMGDGGALFAVRLCSSDHLRLRQRNVRLALRKKACTGPTAGKGMTKVTMSALTPEYVIYTYLSGTIP